MEGWRDVSVAVQRRPIGKKEAQRSVKVSEGLISGEGGGGRGGSHGGPKRLCGQQRAVSDEEGLRELNPFKSPK